MLDVRSFYTISFIDDNPLCCAFIPLKKFECKNCPWRRRLTCQLVTTRRQCTTFGSSKLEKRCLHVCHHL